MKKVLLLAALCCLLTACGNSKPASTTIPIATATIAPTMIALKLYDSTVVKSDIDNLTRADLWAIVPNADNLSESEIQECMRNIITDYTNKNKVTAVTLYLADTTEDVEKNSYTLGRCMYYPGGDIANALNTTAGDYSTFVFNYEIRSCADKEAPTALEIEIYDYVNTELEINDDEDAVNQKAASKYNISVDELNLIWNKVYTYNH